MKNTKALALCPQNTEESTLKTEGLKTKQMIHVNTDLTECFSFCGPRADCTSHFVDEIYSFHR